MNIDTSKFKFNCADINPESLKSEINTIDNFIELIYSDLINENLLNKKDHRNLKNIKSLLNAVLISGENQRIKPDYVFRENKSYGTCRYYPINDRAIQHCNALGFKTLFVDSIQNLRDIGFIVEIQNGSEK